MLPVQQHGERSAANAPLAVSSDSDGVALPGPEPEALRSARGIQGATSISTWTDFVWHCVDAADRIALQATCYFKDRMSDGIVWALQWTAAQQRALDPELELPESEHGNAFSDDASVPDSEAGAVYHALPRVAG